MRIFITTLLVLGSLSTAAQAKCLGKLPEPVSVTTTLEKVISPVYSKNYSPTDTKEYRTVEGCLLQADGKILGYSKNPYHCKLEPGFVGTFIIKKDCCDYTGMPPCDARAEPSNHDQTPRASGKFIDGVIVSD